MKNHNKITYEEGFASITIAFIMIIVLGLLVVGFAQLTRREQQSALNKQLATQAYYAAETGINDVKKMIKNGDINTANGLNEDKCLTGGVIDNLKKVNPSTGAEYTCAIVNTLPKDLKFTGVNPSESKVSDFQAVNDSGAPVTLGSLTITWTSEGATSIPSGSSFLPKGDWNSNNHPSVLQFSLTPYQENSLSRDSLKSATATGIFYPAASTGSVNYSGINGVKAGEIVKSSKNGNQFSVTIDSISSPAGDRHLVHFINYYVKSDIVITGKDTSGNDIYFKDAQIMIDITGKARNVLKRLQVRIPGESIQPSSMPGYALEAQNICKRLKTTPNSTSFDNLSSTPQGACKLDQ